MPTIDRQRISDGFITLERGVDAGKSPSMLPRNQCSFAVNVSMRGGYAKTRPEFSNIPLTFTDATNPEAIDIEEIWTTGRFQGAYYYSHGPRDLIICAVGGYIFSVDINTREVNDLTPKDDPNMPQVSAFYFQQAEQYLIIQDGVSAALIFDGAKCRRANIAADEVPTGTAMAYGNGRLWVARGREFVAGDIVGGPTDVIKFTENTYIAEGGAFAVPLDTGDITAMRFMNQPDSSLGQGELLVHTAQAVFAVNVPTSRDDWKNVSYPTVRIVAINYGAISDRSCVLINSDMFYRAPDGIRSYISSRREWQEYGQIPVSREISPILNNEKQAGIAETTSSVLFDNRMLTTVTPQASDRGQYFRGLTALDFDLVGGTGAKAPAAWEGLWTGLNFLQIMTADVGSESRCFAFHLDPSCLQLWEIHKEDHIPDKPSNVACYIESPSYSFENPFEMKKLEYGEMWVDQIVGDVAFDIKYKPNQYPAWVDWNTFSECTKSSNCQPAAGQCLTLNNYKPQYRSRVRLPQPADSCEATNGVPMRNGYEMSVRIGWTGQARIKGFRMHAYPIIEEPYGGCGDTSCV